MNPGTRHPSSILALYVFRRVLVPSCVLVMVLLGILSLERVLRLLQIVTESGRPVYETPGLVVYLLPHYMGLAMPAGFFLGTLLAVRGLHERSELVAMRSFGMTMRRMQLPVLALSVLLGVVLLAITGFAQPYGRHIFRQHIAGLVTGNFLVGMQNETFHKMGDDVTIRVDRVEADGQNFEGFFMTTEENPGERIILTAESGRRIPPENDAPGADEKLLLSHGTYLVESDREDGKPGKTISFRMEFEEAPVSIPLDRIVKHTGPRGNDEREMTLPELYAGGIPGRETEATPAAIRSELHARIVNVLSLPVLALLATPLALIGHGRGGRASGIAIAVVVFIVYEKVSGLGHIIAEEGRISPLAGLWVPWLVLLLFTGLMFRFHSGDHGGGLFDIFTGSSRRSAKSGTLPRNPAEP